MLGEKYVRKCYNKFRAKYFPGDNLPDFDELDFEFEDAPDEWGSVEWDANGIPSLTLHPATRLYADALKETLLHELIHIKLGSKLGHGRAFWKEAHRIHSLGAYREYFG